MGKQGGPGAAGSARNYVQVAFLVSHRAHPDAIAGMKNGIGLHLHQAVTRLFQDAIPQTQNRFRLAGDGLEMRFRVLCGGNLDGRCSGFRGARGVGCRFTRVCRGCGGCLRLLGAHHVARGIKHIPRIHGGTSFLRAAQPRNTDQNCQQSHVVISHLLRTGNQAMGRSD